MASVKEPHHFSADLRIDNRPVATDDAYLALFAAATAEHVAVGEASVSYLYSRDALPTIVARWPDARFIVCLRNPMDMAYSLHGQALLSGNEDLRDFEDAWDALDDRLRGERIPHLCQAPWTLQYGPVCSLGAQLEYCAGWTA
ncbi:MAG: hypothetical protein LC632_08635 [Xanthomonadaceae bacterium]|nr:hypothetical protein [Xanthomonadaceae bacterium]